MMVKIQKALSFAFYWLKSGIAINAYIYTAIFVLMAFNIYFFSLIFEQVISDYSSPDKLSAYSILLGSFTAAAAFLINVSTNRAQAIKSNLLKKSELTNEKFKNLNDLVRLPIYFEHQGKDNFIELIRLPAILDSSQQKPVLTTYQKQRIATVLNFIMYLEEEIHYNKTNKVNDGFDSLRQGLSRELGNSFLLVAKPLFDDLYRYVRGDVENMNYHDGSPSDFYERVTKYLERNPLKYN